MICNEKKDRDDRRELVLTKTTDIHICTTCWRVVSAFLSMQKNQQAKDYSHSPEGELTNTQDHLYCLGARLEVMDATNAIDSINQAMSIIEDDIEQKKILIDIKKEAKKILGWDK